MSEPVDATCDCHVQPQQRDESVILCYDGHAHFIAPASAIVRVLVASGLSGGC